jgi:hypothetical protein
MFHGVFLDEVKEFFRGSFRYLGMIIIGISNKINANYADKPAKFTLILKKFSDPLKIFHPFKRMSYPASLHHALDTIHDTGLIKNMIFWGAL